MYKNQHGSLEEGIPSETDATDKWLYQLACIFFGSRGFGAYSLEYDCYPDLRKRFQESEANILLVSLAATLRRRTESASDLQNEEVRKRAPLSAGDYIKDINTPTKSVDLTFREACNKIIHADNLEFIYEKEGGILKPFINLFGTFHNKKWKVVLDINLFINCAWHHG